MVRHLPSPGRTVLAASGLRSRARVRPEAVTLARPTGPPSAWTVLGEMGAGLASVRLVAAAPRLARAPRGDGHLVVDIPGWRAPELSGAPLRRYLNALGHDARGWGFGTNPGDPRRDVDRLAGRVLDLVDEGGAAVSLIGWSLGGVLAREVARRHPEAVRRVITYGTPVVGGPAFTTVARAYGNPRAATTDRVGQRLASATPIRVPLTAVYSRRDGIVAWQACIDRSSSSVEHVEVSSTHLGMGIDPDVWALVAERLATDRRPADPAVTDPTPLPLHPVG